MNKQTTNNIKYIFTDYQEYETYLKNTKNKNCGFNQEFINDNYNNINDAIENNESNTSCFNCIDCYECVKCNNCIKCAFSKNCFNCLNCHSYNKNKQVS